MRAMGHSVRWILSLVTTLALVFALAHPGGRPVAEAADGDNLRQISGAYSQGGCLINTGLAFDGTNLLVTCWYDRFIDFISPVDGSLQGYVEVTGPYSGLNAAAWDASRNKLWVCADHMRVLLVDISDGSSQEMFSGYACTDGLAYDGSDDTLWISGDVFSIVSHVQTDGTLIATHDITGMLGPIYGNSGIAVGGGDLYLANNGGAEIYQIPKDFSSSTLFANFNPYRLEDLECDDITFAGQGVGAIWSIDAYDRIINAWEIPKGKCGFGGGVPVTQVQIDVKPNSDPSSFGCKSKGAIPVAVLGSEELDVTQVDVNSVRFGETGVEAAEVHRDGSGNAAGHYEDFNGDGWLDLILHFDFTETGYSCADIPDGEKALNTMAKLTGLMLDGTQFEGEGDLRLVR